MEVKGTLKYRKGQRREEDLFPQAGNHRIERWCEHRDQERSEPEGQGKRSAGCGRQQG